MSSNCNPQPFSMTNRSPTLSHVQPSPAELKEDEDEIYHDHEQEKRWCYDNASRFPPGYRFCPSDIELVQYYLKNKLDNLDIPGYPISEVELYSNNPEYFAEHYDDNGEKIWYFFSPRDRKYPNGDRPSRSTGDGYWKATGADKKITQGGKVIGSRKALVFYRGKPPNGAKTDWIMHEYKVEGQTRQRINQSDMKLDDWVLCKFYKKSDYVKPNRRRGFDGEECMIASCSTPGASGSNWIGYSDHIVEGTAAITVRDQRSSDEQLERNNNPAGHATEIHDRKTNINCVYNGHVFGNSEAPQNHKRNIVHFNGPNGDIVYGNSQEAHQCSNGNIILHNGSASTLSGNITQYTNLNGVFPKGNIYGFENGGSQDHDQYYSMNNIAAAAAFDGMSPPSHMLYDHNNDMAPKLTTSDPNLALINYSHDHPIPTNPAQTNADAAQNALSPLHYQNCQRPPALTLTNLPRASFYPNRPIPSNPIVAHPNGALNQQNCNLIRNIMFHHGDNRG